jgi:hypothetical protein
LTPPRARAIPPRGPRRPGTQIDPAHGIGKT